MLRRLGEASAGWEERSPRAEESALFLARRLLARYGVLFGLLLKRERQPLPWRLLVRALRLLELRGEVLGGRFVSGFSGEQYALATAAAALARLGETAEAPAVVSAADPLNLRGILTPDASVGGGWSQRVPLWGPCAPELTA